MSYILEALKRSESERNQGQVPNLNSYHLPAHVESFAQTNKYWLGAAGVVLIILLLASLVIYFYLQTQTQSIKPYQPAVPSSLVAPEYSKEIEQGLTFKDEAKQDTSTEKVEDYIIKPRSVTPTVRVSDNVKKEVSGEIEEDQWVTVSPKSQQAHVKTAPDHQANFVDADDQLDDESDEFSAFEDEAIDDSPENEHTESNYSARHNGNYNETTDNDRPAIVETAPEEVIPYLYEMSDLVQTKVPALAFSGHLYSNIPSSRQVSINGRKLREGDWLKDIQLLEITKDGAVFEVDSQKFKLLF